MSRSGATLPVSGLLPIALVAGNYKILNWLGYFIFEECISEIVENWLS